MFKHEEKKLREFGEELEKISIPNTQLEKAIQTGFTIAELELKKKRQKRRKSIWSIGIAAVLLLTFVTSIRISPAFANVVASIPGMELIVELIQDDKGLREIVNNDYYQAVHASQTVDDITLTIDGAILDETGILISYTLEAPFTIKDTGYKNVGIYNAKEKIEYAVSTYDHPEQKHHNRKVDLIEYVFQDGFTLKDHHFELEIQLDNDKETTFLVPFTVPGEVKEGKIYSLNEEIEIEGQKMMVEEIRIHPLRVAVKITPSDENTMEILNFEDMRIEDEKGEVWSSIQNGVSAINTDKKSRIYYLQSNYFKQPKKLYFKVNRVQALPKEESFLLVDLEEKKVLNKPATGNFEVNKITSDSIEVRFPEAEDPFHYFLFSTIETLEGTPVEENGQRRWSYEGYEQAALQFIDHDPSIPVKIHFFAYPNYIEGEVSIEMK